MKTHYYTSFVGGGCTIQGDAIVKERAVKAVVMGVFAREQYYRDSQKHESTVHVQRNICEKTLIDFGSSHFYASLVNYSRHSESLKRCMKTVKSLFSKENDVDFEFFTNFKVSLRLE